MSIDNPIDRLQGSAPISPDVPNRKRAFSSAAVGIMPELAKNVFQALVFLSRKEPLLLENTPRPSQILISSADHYAPFLLTLLLTGYFNGRSFNPVFAHQNDNFLSLLLTQVRLQLVGHTGGEKQSQPHYHQQIQ